MKQIRFIEENLPPLVVAPSGGQAQDNTSREASSNRVPEPATPSHWAIRNRTLSYCATIAAVAITAIVRALLDPQLQGLQPFSLFLAPVLLMGWWAGAGPALAAALLGWLAGDYFFANPRGSILHGGNPELTSGIVYVVLSSVLILVTHNLRRARDLAEAALTGYQKSEERFRLFMDQSPTLVWVKDEEGRYVFVNKAYEQRFGLSLPHFRGKTDEQLWDPETAARLREADRRALAAGRPVEMTEETTEGDGTTSYWHNTKFIFTNPGGNRFIASLGLDITPRKLAEDSLRESERFKAAILDSLPAHIAVLDSQGKVIGVNQPWERFGELSGASSPRIGPGVSYLSVCERASAEGDASATTAREGILGVLRGERTQFALEYPCHSPNQQRWFVMTVTHLATKAGGATVSHLDTTDRKKAEAALQASERRYREVIESLPQLVWTCEADGWCDYLSPQWIEYTGRPAAEQMGNGWSELVHQDDRTAVLTAWEEATRTGSTYQVVFRIRRHDGVYRWFRTVAVPLRDQDGNIVKWFGTNTDSHDLKTAEQALRQSETRFRTYIEATNNVIWRTNARGEVDDPVPSWNAFTGQSVQEAAGFGWLNAVDPQDRERVVQAWMSASENRAGYQVEYRLRRRDGQQRQVMARGVPILSEEGEILEYVGTCIDITAQREAEESLRRSEQKFRAIFEQAAIGIGLVRFSDARWIDVNESFCRSLGYSPQFMRRTPWTEITHPDDVELDLVLFRRMAAGELDSYSVEKRFIHREGHPIWARLTLSLVRDPQGRPDYEIAIVENVQDRKTAEQALREQADLLDQSTDALIAREMDGTIRYWSRGAEELFGYSSEEALNRTCFELLRTRLLTNTEQCGPNPPLYRERWQCEYEQTTRDGRRLTIEANARQAGRQGRTLILEALRDVTSRKQAEEALRESEARYRTLFDSIDEGFCIVEMLFDEQEKPIDYCILQVNRAFGKQTGLTSAEGKRMRELAPELEEHWFETYGRIALTGQAARFQAKAEQLHRWYDVYAFRFGRPEQRLVGILFSDITDRKQHEEALRHQTDALAAALRDRDEALSQLNGLLANAPIGFAFFDRAHRYTRINEFLALQINGLPVDAHLGRTITEVLPFNARNVGPLLEGVFNSGRPAADIVVTGETPAAPGEERHWLTAWFPVRTPDGSVPWVGGVVLEITQEKRTEATLARRNQHLQLLHDTSARLLAGAKPLDLIREMHGQIAELFGADMFVLYEADPQNKNLHLLAAGGISEAERRKFAKLRSGSAICQKTGTALQAVAATHLQDREDPSHRFLRKMGLRSYLYYPFVIHNRLHATLAFASRVRDDYDPTDLEFFHTIASTLAAALERERLQAEVQRHTSDLEEAVEERTAKLRETIAELEGFSYSLVHDMRGPLRAMEGFAGILEVEASRLLDREHAIMLGKIRVAARRMDQLVTDSLNYSKLVREDLPMGPVDLGALLHGMVETYPNLHEPNAEVIMEVGRVMVEGNEAALTQVFSNLLGNAVKFVPPGVHPRVRVWVEPPLCESSLARVMIQDNGIGIPQGQGDRIFGMFQRLHRSEEYPGTGIGLALVKKSLERTGGRVSYQSEPGKGTRFSVELPRSERT